MKRKLLFAACALLAAVSGLMAGCATDQAQGPARRYFFPPLPERPRIEWIASYSSQLDFPRTGFQKFMDTIAGAPEPITFSRPIDIVSTGKGRVYVADPGLSMVFVYDFNAYDVHPLGKEEAIGIFKQPVGVTLDNEDNLYVSDTDKKMVFVFTKDEKVLRAIDCRDNLRSAGGIAIDHQRNRLVVADTKGHKVGVYDLSGRFLFSFGDAGTEDGKFNFPVPVAVNHAGEYLIGDVMNARIQIFDSTGAFLRKFGNRGDGNADFQILKGLAVDSDDNIYVTDGKAHKINIYDTKGQFLMTMGGLYSVLTSGREAAAGFVLPQGIDIDRNDRIFVVDQMNNRFQVFQYISDAFLKKNPIDGYLAPLEPAPAATPKP